MNHFKDILDSYRDLLQTQTSVIQMLIALNQFHTTPAKPSKEPLHVDEVQEDIQWKLARATNPEEKAQLQEILNQHNFLNQEVEFYGS